MELDLDYIQKHIEDKTKELLRSLSNAIFYTHIKGKKEAEDTFVLAKTYAEKAKSLAEQGFDLLNDNASGEEN